MTILGAVSIEQLVYGTTLLLDQTGLRAYIELAMVVMLAAFFVKRIFGRD